MLLLERPVSGSLVRARQWTTDSAEEDTLCPSTTEPGLGGRCDLVRLAQTDPEASNSAGLTTRDTKQVRDT